MTPAERGLALFATDIDHGSCCDCCEGYCGLEDVPTFEGLVAATVAGVDYVGERYLLVRADVAEVNPDAIVIRAPHFSGTVPAATPPRYLRPMAASTLGRIDRAGLTVHGVEGETPLHVYLDGEHVGWTMPVSDESLGIDLDALQVVRRVATATGLSMNKAALAVRQVRLAEAGL